MEWVSCSGCHERSAQRRSDCGEFPNEHGGRRAGVETADLSTTLGSGRDDKSAADRDFGFPGKVRGTADPSASLGFPVESGGFGQLYVVLFRENHISGAIESGEVGNPGSLGMTKERATTLWRAVAGPKSSSGPWVDYRPITTPVKRAIQLQENMVSLVERADLSTRTGLSSRPERSVVERSAVSAWPATQVMMR
jgi:hypothetical protein